MPQNTNLSIFHFPITSPFRGGKGGVANDASGERVWKHNGPVQQMWINQEQTYSFVDLNNATLYASAYMVVNDHEYTKHYYTEGQKVCSKLGGGFEYSLKDIHDELTPITGVYEDIISSSADKIRRDFDCVGFPIDNYQINSSSFTEFLESITSNNKNETDLYYYHSDHLGSSSFITDASGLISQHMQYLPFGELFIEQQTDAAYRTPYKFSAKEKDEETSYSYFGARYYMSDFSFWLSVDPLADKYPSLSPYAYCALNPVMLVDPNGKSYGPPIIKGVSNIRNVLSGKNWVDYRNNIIRTRTFLGFEISRTSKHEQCADYSRLQVEEGSNGKYTAVGSKKRIDMFLKSDQDKSNYDLQKGINTIIKNLEEGKAVMAGVMYDSEKETGNANQATNHYVTIVGMGKDDEGIYFSYYDNYTSGKGENIGTEVQNNKFRLSKDSNGNYYFADRDNNIPLNGNNNIPLYNKDGKPSRYFLTEIRNNE